jgi:shikimate dehydrogenase
MTGFSPMVTGSFSEGAAENPTPVMMNGAYAHHGIDAVYVNCEVPAASLAEAVRGARAMGWQGFNCSMPHKKAVIPLLDELDRSASIIGAVNCVTMRDGRLVGSNTDGKGFVDALRTVADCAGLDVVVIGAGGAASAIAVELALAGARRIRIIGRTPERARLIADAASAASDVSVDVLPYPDGVVLDRDADVVVNATPLGLEGTSTSSPDVDLGSARDDLVVADVIANPVTTQLIARARDAGLRTLDGLGMLVNQGADNIERWTGVSTDRTVMRAALEAIV